MRDQQRLHVGVGVLAVLVGVVGQATMRGATAQRFGIERPPFSQSLPNTQIICRMKHLVCKRIFKNSPI